MEYPYGKVVSQSLSFQLADWASRVEQAVCFGPVTIRRFVAFCSERCWDGG